MPGGDQDRAEHDQRDPHDDIGFFAQYRHRVGAEAEKDHQVDDEHDQQDGSDKAAHQPGGVLALGFLTFEKLRGHIS